MGAVGRKTDRVCDSESGLMLTDDVVQTLLDGSQPALVGVHPTLIVRVMNLITHLGNEDIPFGAFMGLRTFKQQDALWAQGRTLPGKIVTKAKGGESFHNFGLAVDMVEDGDVTRAGIQWSWSNNADYLKVGSVTKDCGLEWGGFWKAFKDYPHVQLTGGLSLAEANKIYFDAKEDNNAVWEAVDRRLAA